MVLYPFNVRINILVLNADRRQKRLQQLMTVYESLPHLLAFVRQNQPAIFLIYQVIILVELLNHLRDRGGMNL
ncbi:hypothetical protein D3C78_1386580 [compost metagenome]